MFDALKVEKLVQPYYEALEEGKILGRRCPECGHIEFPPRYACNECGCMDTEWVEISGKAKATKLIPQSPMQHNDELTEQFGNFVWATVQLDECDVMDGFNTLVLKVEPDQLEELNKHLPVPVKAVIVDRGSYKQVFWELDE